MVEYIRHYSSRSGVRVLDRTIVVSIGSPTTMESPPDYRLAQAREGGGGSILDLEPIRAVSTPRMLGREIDL